MTDLPRLPPQPNDTVWPTANWPLGEIPKVADRARFAGLVEHAFAKGRTDDLGETHALVVVQHGRLLFERYAAGRNAGSTFPSWSMAKSITHALVGILVKEDLIDIHAPATVPEWRSPGEKRAAITLDLLLRMSSGLEFLEEYLPDKPSDVIEMLWGTGKDDVAHFAASFPLEHAPGTFWSYSSGTTNIVARAAASAAGLNGAGFEAFMRQRLFEPLGMRSPIPKFDAAGTFIGSSFCFATAQDFARFGTLYLRDGVWDGKRLLPEGWVDYARTPTWQQPTDKARYGAHWWLDIAGPGTFSANGYDGQFTAVIPERDMILVRHGATPGDIHDNVKGWLKAIAECFPGAA